MSSERMQAHAMPKDPASADTHASRYGALPSDLGAHVTPAQNEVSLFEALTPLVRARRVLVRAPLIAGIVVFALSFLIHKRFTATTTFVADGGSVSLPGSLAGLAGLAGQMGISGLGSGPSPQTYAEILNSRELLTATLQSKFADPDGKPGDSTRTLLDILDAGGSSDRERLEKGLKLFRSRVTTKVGRTTDIIECDVELEGPELAADVANRMVALLNEFNLDRRRTQSGEQRRFAEERMKATASELRDAEANLLQFVQANRRYQDSPVLQYENERLSRQVQQKQELFLTLSRKYEEARIAEVQDTPVITTIDRAVPPYKKSYPKRLLLALAAVFVTGLATFAWVFATEFWRRAKSSDNPDFRTFVETWHIAKRVWGRGAKRSAVGNAEAP